MIVPAGEYEAFRILLGEAKGKNWWCIMFPTLCYVDEVYDVITEENKAKFQEILTKEEYENLFNVKELENVIISMREAGLTRQEIADALGRSQHGWHEGTEDVMPFIKYILGTILAAYKDFEDRFSIVEEKLPAIEMVRKASLNKIGRFTKQDIRELCPSLSVSSVEGALRKMVSEGELKREGSGKSTCYYRLK